MRELNYSRRDVKKLSVLWLCCAVRRTERTIAKRKSAHRIDLDGSVDTCVCVCVDVVSIIIIIGGRLTQRGKRKFRVGILIPAIAYVVDDAQTHVGVTHRNISHESDVDAVFFSCGQPFR